MFNLKKKLNLKKILITTICLFVVFSLSGVLTYLVNTSKNQVQPITVEENVEPVSTDSDLIEQPGFALNWKNDEDKKVIRPMAVTQPSEEKKYFVTTSGEFETIQAGTLISVKSHSYTCNESQGTLSCSGEHCEITLYSSEDDMNNETNNIGQAILHFDKGLDFDNLKLGYYSDSIDDANTNFVHLYSFDTETSDKTFGLHAVGSTDKLNYITPEDLDPHYTGQLGFVPKAELKTYMISLYTTDTSEDYTTAFYNINGIYNRDSLDDYKPKNPPANSEFEGWLLNLTKIKGFNIYSHSIDDENNTITITYESSLNVMFTYSGDKIESKGSDYYLITEVKGYGSFSRQETKFITAKFAKSYNLTLDNSSNYWNNETLGTQTESSLYGAVSSTELDGTDDGDFTKTTLTISKTTETGFKSTTAGTSFAKIDAVEDSLEDYCFYNYGHKYSKVRISITYDGGKRWLDSNFNLFSGGSDVKPAVSLINEKGKTFGDLAILADGMIGYSNISFTITPVWEAETFDVVDKDDATKIYGDNISFGGYKSSDGTYGDSYTLNPADPPVCYKQTNDSETYIANSAVWNYKNLTYSYSNGTYSTAVEPVALDSIYKVSLAMDIVPTSFSNYTITTDVSQYNKPSYGYGSDELGTVDAYNSTTYPLVDSYSNYLSDYITNYTSTLNGFDGLNKVFNNGGSYYIYLKNNANQSFPEWVGTNAQIIAWKASSRSFGTSAYKSDYSSEATVTTENWNNETDETILTAVYVYGLDLYYGVSNETYSSEKAEYYGENTELTIDEVPANPPTGKTFVSWMLNKTNATDYTIDDSESGKIKLTKDGKTTIFGYDGVNGNYYLNISSVQGYLFTQDSANPIIVARYFGNEYNVTVNNSSTYWNSETLGTQTESSLYGALSSAETTDDGDFTTTSFKIVNNDNSVYGFQSNRGKAFYKHDNYYKNDGTFNYSLVNSRVYEREYYLVYNYGHEISGWKVKVTHYDAEQEKNVETSFKFDKATSKWVEGAGPTIVKDLVEKGQTLQDLAAFLDVHFVNGEVVSVTLTPNWEEAEIDAKYGNDIVGGFEYTATNYTLKTDIIDSEKDEGCRTLFAYEKGENLIALSGVWNYYQNLGFEDYGHDDESGKYSIAVEPVFVDNIIQVGLNKVLPTETGKYELDVLGTQGAYNYSNVNYSATRYNFDDYSESTYQTYTEDGSKALMDDYITQLALYKDNWETGINGSFNILRKVYYSTGSYSDNVLTANNPDLWIYLVDDQSVGSLPTFNHEFAQIIAWDYDTSTSYKANNYADTFSAEMLTTSVNVGGNWTYNESPLSAHYVYRLDLYYEAKTPTDGAYSTKNAEWYGANTTLSFYDGDELKEGYAPEEKDIVDGKTFVSWMVDADMAENGTYVSDVTQNVYGYLVIQDETNKTITIKNAETNPTFSITFTYREKSSNYGYYYQITSVKGSGVFIQNKTDSEDNLYPIVKADLSNKFETTINNSGAYWSGFDDTKDDSTLYGAVSSDELSDVTTAEDPENFTKTTIIISNNSDYAYGFQNNDGSAFLKKGDIIIADKLANGINHGTKLTDSFGTEKFYIVYNYGHEISGWSVVANGISFIYDKATSKWVEGAGSTTVATLNEKGQTLQTLSAFLDEYFKRKLGKTTVTLIPNWDGVTIATHYVDINDDSSKTQSGSIKFAGISGYTLNYPSTLTNVPTEKSIFAYSSAGSTVAKAGMWNYKNLTIQNEGSGYKIELKPILVDDIFKINLTNVKIKTTNKYVLGDCDYQFNASSGSYDQQGKTELTFENYVETGVWEYKNYNAAKKDYPLIDNYITQLGMYKTTWEAGITGSFGILRKVYYSSNNTVTVSEDKTTLETTNPTLWIYFANGQNTGRLPVFEKDDYIQILWKNTAHNDKTSCSEPSNPCTNLIEHYVYKTSNFDINEHFDEINGKYTWHDSDSDNIPDDIWFRSDGVTTDGVITLEAFYYRKYIEVEISTLFDTQRTDEIEEEIARRGYVYVWVKDNVYLNDTTIINTGGNYLIIAETIDDLTSMMVYKINDGTAKITSFSLSNYWDTTNNVIINADEMTQPIRLYLGCDLNIYIIDQSQDETAMASGYFDEMIGYKFKGDIKQEDGVEDFLIFDEESTYDYKNEITKVDYEDVLLEYYKDNTPLKFGIYFTEILYELNFKIDNVKAGEFNVQENQYFANNNTSYTLADMYVGNLYKVDYFAFAGFKLKEGAFTLKLPNETIKNLQAYDELTYKANYEADPDTADESLISQLYTLTGKMNGKNYLDGTWLRTYFYDNGNFDVRLNKLGELKINTEAIEFNYGVHIYDEFNGLVDNDFIVETLSDGTLKLTENTGKTNIDSVGTYLNNSLGFYHYTSENKTTNYAVLSSRLYFPNNYTLESDENYWTSYDFLLNVNPTKEFEILPKHLARMVEEFEDGKIISNLDDNREIFIMLEVRRLFEIEMKAIADSMDSNDTARTITLANGNRNSKSLNLSVNEGITSGYFNTVQTIYSYQGLENRLSSIYDSTRYNDVKYYLNNTANELTNSLFTLESYNNQTLLIKFVPNSLGVEFIYKIDGVTKELSEVSSYISETIKPLASNRYALNAGNNKVAYEVESRNPDYNVRVTINTRLMGTTDNATRKLTFTGENSYQVSSNDFNRGIIQIVVEIIEIEGTRISVRYQLNDASKFTDSDRYGTFKVISKYGENSEVELEESVSVDDNVSAFIEVNIVEDRDVYIETSLPKGYVLIGYKRAGASSPTTLSQAEINANKFKLIKNFDPDVDNVDYLILIDKISITATLNTTGLEATYRINGRTSLTNLFVGSVVNFTNVDVDAEKLNYFYYYKADGTTEVKIEGNKITITSELIEEIGNKTQVDFNVAVTKYYKLDLTIAGSQYLDEDGLTIINVTDSQNYVSGTYVEKGTKIKFSVTPENVGKYDVIYDEEEAENELVDVEIVLDANHAHTITISPKQYSVIVSESVYENLEQINSGSPTNVADEDEQVNELDAQGQSYNDQATLTFVRVVERDRELSQIKISNNDLTEIIVIDFDGETYVAKLGDSNGDEIDLSTYDYSITLIDNKIQLSYTTYNDITIALEYKDYKVISSS